MIRTIFFDFGNVVGFFDHARALAKLAAHTDMPTADLDRVLYGGALLDDYEHGRITTAEYVRRAREGGRLGCTDDEFLLHFADIFRPNPEVCDLVPRLKPQHRVVLASNTCDAHYVKYTALFADTLRHFDELAGASHLLNARKPNAGFFEALHAHAHAEPHECLFVDDLPANVAAAERFGWNAVLYRPDGTLAEKLRAAGATIR